MVKISALDNDQPLGTFHAVTTRDGLAVERDGCPFYAMTDLPSRTEPLLCEIRFADGTWMLANNQLDLVWR